MQWDIQFSALIDSGASRSLLNEEGIESILSIETFCCVYF